VLSRPDQIAALASPVRLEIIERFQTEGPASIRDIAERMDRSADSLYYHVRHLLGAGILVQEGSRRRGRKDEAVYALAARRIQGESRPKSEAAREELLRSVGAVLRLAERNFRSAIGSGSAVTAGSKRNTFLRRQKAWLTDVDLEELRRRIEGIESL